MQQVFAKWENIKELPEDLSGIHISCGAGENQFTGFYLEDVGAKLTMNRAANGTWEVIFTAPSNDIEKEADYWLSPSLINDEIEAEEFGIKGA